MNEVQKSVAHPPSTRVEVLCGSQQVTIRPWTMAQRAELRPRVADVLDRIMQTQANPQAMNLAHLFVVAENEIAEIVRATVEMPEGLTWDQLLWEDLPTLAQAIWETSIVREDGGGLAGKVMGVVAQAMNSKQVLEAMSILPPPTGTNSSASPSSPDVGAPTPNA